MSEEAPGPGGEVGRGRDEAPVPQGRQAGLPQSEAERRFWSRRSDNPLAVFVQTETAGALALLVAAAAALVWSNADEGSYVRIWGAVLTVSIGHSAISMSITEWINSGLMTFFFLVVGLEARREVDIGDLRERQRIIAPFVAGLGGMAAAVVVYLLINLGVSSQSGWGTAMSTDTAFALGVLVLIRPPFRERLRVFLLTVVIVDDMVTLVIVATVYTEHLNFVPLLVALCLIAVIVVMRVARIRQGLLMFALAIPAWVALEKSGVDPVILGLVLGLLAYDTPSARSDLERATELFRGFREQPTPEFARAARRGLIVAVAPNERLEELYHPWTSLLIVPLFTLANFGLVLNGSFLTRALGSAITLGVLLAFVVGKPIGIGITSFLVSRLSRHRVRPSVGWLSVAGGGTLAGIPFTVSLLVASLAFSGMGLREAKLGILLAAIISPLAAWSVFRVASLMPPRRRAVALLGSAEETNDLALPVDPERDHIRGPQDAMITLVEYGDFQCPYCGQAETVVRALLADFGDVRYVWRHLPLVDVHPRARLAAIASEASAVQAAFWPMYDLLFAHQDALRPDDLVGYAVQLGLDTDRFRRDLEARIGVDHIAEDVDSADLSGVAGTPTFFINGRRHRGAYDLTTLTEAVRLAKAERLITQDEPESLP